MTNRMPANTLFAASASLAGALALAACSPAPDTQADPAGEAQDAPGEYGISEEATEANQAIANAGVIARELSRPMVSAERGDVADRMEAYLAENEGDLPAGLAEAASEDLQSVRDAIAAGDDEAAMAAGEALVETLRAAAPVGGEISGS